jgi:hypothetical protein
MIALYRQIDGARSPLELVSVLRDYIAGWTPAEIARLPESCRPGKVRDAEDIETLHECLVEEFRGSRASGDDLALLQQLTSVMVRACIRLAELRDVSAGGSSAPPPGPAKSAAPREKG